MCSSVHRFPGAARGMFGLCNLNKQKFACIASESWANPASIPAWSIQHTTRCGGLPPRNTHLAPGLYTHIHTHTVKFLHTEAGKKPQRHNGGRRETVSHSGAELHKQTNNLTFQAVVRDSLKRMNHVLRLRYLNPLNICLSIWRHASGS